MGTFKYFKTWFSLQALSTLLVETQKQYPIITMFSTITLVIFVTIHTVYSNSISDYVKIVEKSLSMFWNMLQCK